jgi:hypothetical protein
VTVARGPLPDPSRRRRNAPSIPTTSLPISGRTTPAPDVPSWVHLGTAGTAWWAWAWATPQASAWGVGAGAEAVVARRASLEDDLAALERIDGLHLDELREDEDEEDRRIAGVIRRIAAMATGRLQILREMRELDDRLGLTPKSLAALRWTIVADAASTPTGPTPPTPATKSATDRKLRLIGNGSNG